MATGPLEEAIERLYSDSNFQRAFRRNPEKALTPFNLTPAEINALKDGDADTLATFGVDVSKWHNGPSKPLSWLVGLLVRTAPMTLAVMLWCGALVLSPAIRAGQRVPGTRRGTRSDFFSTNNIHDVAHIWNDGDMVVITGPFNCEEGEVIEIRVQVTQESGAIGEGTVNAFCESKQDQWMAIVKTWGTPFTPGPADAHAWATTWTKDGVDRSWGWGNDITLK